MFLDFFPKFDTKADKIIAQRIDVDLDDFEEEDEDDEDEDEDEDVNDTVIDKKENIK